MNPTFNFYLKGHLSSHAEAEQWHVALYTNQGPKGWAYRTFIAALGQRVGLALDSREKSAIALDMIFEAEKAWQIDSGLISINPTFGGFMKVIKGMLPSLIDENGRVAYRYFSAPKTTAAVIKWLLANELGDDMAEWGGIDFDLWRVERRAALARALFVHENYLYQTVEYALDAGLGLVRGTTAGRGGGKFIRVTHWGVA